MQKGYHGHLGPENKLKIEEAKKAFQDKAKRTLSMRLDFPDQHGSGGNTDTSQIARRFFLEENREGVVALFNPPKGKKKAAEFIKDVTELHRKIAILLRVMMSRRKASLCTLGFASLSQMYSSFQFSSG